MVIVVLLCVDRHARLGGDSGVSVLVCFVYLCE